VNRGTRISRRDFIIAANSIVLGGMLAHFLGQALELFKYEVGQNVLGIFPCESWEPYICDNCRSGCTVLARIVNGEVVKLEGDPINPVNAGSLCPRGHIPLQLLNMPNRLVTPMLREEGRLKTTSFRRAFGALAKAVEEARSAYLIGGEEGTAGEVIKLLISKVGGGAVFHVNPSPYPTPIHKYRFILLFGADILNDPNYIMHNLKSYSMLRGSGRRHTIIYISPRRSVTGLKSDSWIAIKPGTYGALALGMASHMIATGMFTEELLKQVTPTYREVLDVIVDSYSPGWASEKTGVDESVIVKLAEEFYGNRPSIAVAGYEALLWNNGPKSQAAVTLINLLAGVDPRPLMPQVPFNHLPGYRQVKEIVSFNLVELVEEVEKNFPSIVIFGNFDPFFEVPEADKLLGKIAQSSFIISTSPFVRELERSYADLVIPYALPMERWVDGATITLEGRSAAYASAPILREAITLPSLILKVLSQYYGVEISTMAEAVRYRWMGIWESGTGTVGTREIQEFKTFNEFFDEILKGRLWIGGVARPIDSLREQLAEIGWEEPIKIGDGKFLMHPYRTLTLDPRFGECPWLYQRPSPLLPEEKFEIWVEVNPEDASEMGVADGETVRVRGSRIPLGMGRRIEGWGVIGDNPLKLISTVWRGVSYAKFPLLYSTRVDILR